MRVAILGSGVVGVASAWYLAKAGHEVTVIDRQLGPALETSFANAGEISPGYASPWAAPGIPLKALRWLFMKHAPLILRPQVDPAMLRWLMAMLGNCTSAAYEINKRRMVRVAEHSRACLIALRQETGIAYDEASRGTLQLFRTEKQLDGMAKDVAVLKADGVPFEILDRFGCLAAEPGLAFSTASFAGGLRLPNDETGDCFKFTNALAALCAAQGVTFLNERRILSLISDNGRISGIETDRGRVLADAYVVALGSHSPQLVAPLGLCLPVYPVKGYSITIRSSMPPARRFPRSWMRPTRWPSRASATVSGSGAWPKFLATTMPLPPRRQATLNHVVTSLFPGAGDMERATFWCGLRPMTPDSTPVIGTTPFRNLFLNTGHGTLGWTMACGSGDVIASIISGTQPAIDVRDLAIARYSGAR